MSYPTNPYYSDLIQRFGVATFQNITAQQDASVERNLAVDGNFSLGGSMDVSGGALFRSDLEVSGDAAVDGSFGLGGNLDVSGDAAVDGSFSLGGNLEVSGDAAVDGSFSLGGNLEVSGDAAVDGSFTVAGGVYVMGALTAGGELDMSGFRVIGMADPSGASDAVTKNYVDSVVGGAETGIVGISYTAATDTTTVDNCLNVAGSMDVGGVGYFRRGVVSQNVPGNVSISNEFLIIRSEGNVAGYGSGIWGKKVTNGRHSLLFKTYTGTSNPREIERMRIDNTGVVGINTTIPDDTYRLDVSGAARVTGQLDARAVAATRYYGTANPTPTDTYITISDDQIEMGMAGSTDLTFTSTRIQSASSLNLSTDQSVLEINSAGTEVRFGQATKPLVHVPGDLYADASLIFGDDTVTNPRWMIDPDTDALTIRRDDDVRMVLDHTNDRITLSGKVGIGLTDPVHALHVKSGTNAIVMSEADSAAVPSQCGFAFGNGENEYWGVVQDETLETSSMYIAYGAKDVSFNQTSLDSLQKFVTVKTDGTVGIGTTTPNSNYILDVDGSANVSGNLDVDGSANVGGALYVGGQVGVGTTSLAAAVHVATGTTNHAIVMSETDPADQLGGFVVGAGEIKYFGMVHNEAVDPYTLYITDGRKEHYADDTYDWDQLNKLVWIECGEDAVATDMSMHIAGFLNISGGVSVGSLNVTGGATVGGTLNMSSQKITELSDGIEVTDAVNKGQMDTAITDAFSSTNITTDGTSTGINQPAPLYALDVSGRIGMTSEYGMIIQINNIPADTPEITNTLKKDDSAAVINYINLIADASYSKDFGSGDTTLYSYHTPNAGSVYRGKEWSIGLLLSDDISANNNTGMLLFSHREENSALTTFSGGGNTIAAGVIAQEKDGTNAYLNNFTGQHHNYGVDETIDLSLVGFIVSSTGSYRNQMADDDEANKFSITINESLPIVDLSKRANDKRVFGVISSKDDTGTSREKRFGNFVSFHQQESLDRPLTINSLGEGALWVCDWGGPIENGDYVTSSPIPGLGMLQADDLLHNYTVAKVTMDCDFSEVLVPKKRLRTTTDACGNEQPVINDDGVFQYEPELDASGQPVLVEKYERRFVAVHADRFEIYLDEARTQLHYTHAFDFAGGDTQQQACVGNTYTMAFVGCTYHCG
jgi:hypothetical protein